MKPFFSVIIYTILIAFCLSNSLDSFNDIDEMKQLMEKAFDKTLQKLNGDGLLKKLKETEQNRTATQNQKLITDNKNNNYVMNVDSNRKLPLTVHHHKKRIVSIKHGKVHVHNDNVVGEHHSHHQEIQKDIHIQTAHTPIDFGKVNRPLISFKDHPENDHPLPIQLVSAQVHPTDHNCRNALGEPKDKSVSLKTRFRTHKLTKKHDKQTVERSNNYKSVSHKTHIDTFYQNDRIESKDHKHSTKHTIGVDEFNVPFKEDVQENSLHKVSHIINHDKNDPNKDEEIITMSNMVQEFTKDDSFMAGRNGNGNPFDFLNETHNNLLDNIQIHSANLTPTHSINAGDHDSDKQNILDHINSVVNNNGINNPKFSPQNVRPQFSNQQIDQLLDHLQDDGDENGVFDILGHKIDSNDNVNGDEAPMEFFHYKNMNRQQPSFLPTEHKEINGSPFPQQFKGLLAGLMGALGNIGSYENGFSQGPALGHSFSNKLNPHLVIPSFQSHEAEPHHDNGYRPIDNAKTLEKELPSDMSNLFSVIGNLTKINQGASPNYLRAQENIKKPTGNNNLNKIGVINDTNQPQIVDHSESSDYNEDALQNAINQSPDLNTIGIQAEKLPNQISSSSSSDDSDEKNPKIAQDQIIENYPNELQTDKPGSQDISKSSSDSDEEVPNGNGKDIPQSTINQANLDNNELAMLQDLLKANKAEQQNPQLLDINKSNAQSVEDSSSMAVPEKNGDVDFDGISGDNQDLEQMLKDQGFNLGQFNEDKDLPTGAYGGQNNGDQNIELPQDANTHNINLRLVGPSSNEFEDITDNRQKDILTNNGDEEDINDLQMLMRLPNSLRGLL